MTDRKMVALCPHCSGTVEAHDSLCFKDEPVASRLITSLFKEPKMAGDSEADEKRYGPLDRDIDHAGDSEEDVLDQIIRLSTARHDGEASWGDLGMGLVVAGLEIVRLRAALRDVAALTVERKAYDHEDGLGDRLESIHDVTKKALGNA